MTYYEEKKNIIVNIPIEIKFGNLINFNRAGWFNVYCFFNRFRSKKHLEKVIAEVVKLTEEKEYRLYKILFDLLKDDYRKLSDIYRNLGDEAPLTIDDLLAKSNDKTAEESEQFYNEWAEKLEAHKDQEDSHYARADFIFTCLLFAFLNAADLEYDSTCFIKKFVENTKSDIDVDKIEFNFKGKQNFEEKIREVWKEGTRLFE